MLTRDSRGLHTFSSHNNTGYWPSLGRHPSGIDFSYQGWQPNPNVNMPRPVSLELEQHSQTAGLIEGGHIPRSHLYKGDECLLWEYVTILLHEERNEVTGPRALELSRA